MYNTKNLMRSSVKWYGKDDLIPQSQLYVHCLYVCRKAKNKMGYLTDGNIEVLYDKGAKVAITILELKDKFKPVTQYIKPEVLKQIEIKKENKKMRKKAEIKIGLCPDCGREEVELLSPQNICVKCKTRLNNMKHRGKEYIPYIKLSDEEKKKIDRFQETNAKISENKKEKLINMKPIEKAVEKAIDPLTDQNKFVQTLRGCGCEIPKENLIEVLDVLVATNKLKDIFMTIAKSDNQDAMLNLEQALNVVERKLQHDWEFNGFREEDDVKFKNFLTWRRTLKGAIYFWKKLYQTNALIEMQRAWNAYTQDPNEKILLAGDRINTALKRYQITTESISTIFNTRRPFTRVFYATSQDEAYNMFVKWMSDRQLHEDKSKTTITELTQEGEDGRKEQ